MTSQPTTSPHSEPRFAFGKNWAKFLKHIDEDRIRQAENSLRMLLKDVPLAGKRFLDIGSGSGLMSLAARRLGAVVYSFDFDPQSVQCTAELKRRYCPEDTTWQIQQGSILDRDYLQTLGQFDVVYSWGVLHHTGALWQAMEHAALLVADNGWLAVAVYNDQGSWSQRWRVLKRIYNSLPGVLRPIYAALVLGPRELKFLLLSTLKGKPWEYFDQILNYSARSTRGMSYWHDLIDWIGGYPFEVAKPEEVFEHCTQRGFVLERLKTSAGSIACNEFVFRKVLEKP